MPTMPSKPWQDKVERRLRDGAQSVAALAAHFKSDVRPVQAAINALRKRNLIYVAKHEPPPSKGRWTPVYGLRLTGAELDATPPVPGARFQRAALQALLEQKLTHAQMAASLGCTVAAMRHSLSAMGKEGRMIKTSKDDVLVLLHVRKMTRGEIEAHFGTAYTQAGHHLRQLRLAGRAFICEWRQGSTGHPAAVYAAKVLADQVDAPEPVGKPRAAPKRVARCSGVRSRDVKVARERAPMGPWAGL